MPFHVGRYILNRRKIPHTHFSMLNEIYLELLAPLEEAGVRLTDDMMPDISTGRMFSDFLRKKGIDVDSCPRCEHEFLGNRQPVSARLYPVEFLAEFRRWFHEQWMPNRSNGYFQERLPPAVLVIKKIIAQLEHEPKKNGQSPIE